MQTITIKVADDKVLKLINQLENLGLIQIDERKKTKEKLSLSQKMAGSIPVQQAATMEEELEKMRTEWNCQSS